MLPTCGRTRSVDWATAKRTTSSTSPRLASGCSLLCSLVGIRAAPSSSAAASESTLSTCDTAAPAIPRAAIPSHAASISLRFDRVDGKSAK
eukprot:6282689-Prymnesium_polylepis.3